MRETPSRQPSSFDWTRFEFVSAIKERLERFTRRQRRVAEFVLRQPESLVFLSITELAKKADTSEATVVRFCNTLGFEGYSQLTGKVRNHIQQQFGSVDRFNLGRLLDRYAEGQTGDDSIFTRVISSEIENLFNLTRSIRASDFHACVDRVISSDRIVVVGAQASSALALHMHQMLAKVVSPVDRITHQEVTSSTLLRQLTKRSTVFLITFPRYAKFSLEIAAAAKEMGAFIVVLTDSHLSPAVELADMIFFISVDVPSFVDAYAAPVAFINALATDVGVRSPERSREALDHYDRIVAKWKLFFKKDSERGPLESHAVGHSEAAASKPRRGKR